MKLLILKSKVLILEDGFVYRVVFMLASGESVPLSGVYSSGFEEKQQIVKMIKSFLASQ